MNKILSAAAVAIFLPSLSFAADCALPQQQLFAPIDTHAFASIDCNGDEALDASEIQVFLDAYAGFGSPDTQTLITQLDRNESGIVEPSEFPDPAGITRIIKTPKAGTSFGANNL